MSRVSEIMPSGVPAETAKAIVGKYAAISGAGTVTGDATVITTANVLISGGAGSSGVRLPVSHPGDSYNIKNQSGQTIILYPPAGGTINSAASSLSLATATSVTVFFSTSTVCHSIPTVAS